MTTGLSVNRLAWKLLEKMLKNPGLYRVKVGKTDSETILVDAGVEAKGGFEAGRLVTQICMGGCGRARITCRRYGDLELPSIFVYTDYPVIATLGSQYAGWQISEDGYFAIGSGPARALAQKPKEIFEEIRYKDDFDKAIVVLETDKYPPEKLVDRIVKDCKVSHENLAMILTPTTSVAGATQVSGRIVETGVHKLRKVGLDPSTILYAWGVAPIAPSHPKFTKAMARTNDAILYGGTAYYAVNHGDEEELKRVVEKSPSRASRDYGKPFIEIFKEAKYDFYKIDPDLFAPAVIIVNNLRTGNTFRSGEIKAEALTESFSLEAL
jgi:methenyltetrahydromethanopterin cyclohydrolase